MEKEKKVIIALYGPGNKGKSKTINLLIKLLGGSESDKERRISLTYEDKKIAITTYGDDDSQLNKNIKFFKEKSCDILVTATRTKGKSVKTLETFEKEIGRKAIWIAKSYLDYTLKPAKGLKESLDSSQRDAIFDKINTQQAQCMKDVIDMIIKEWDNPE